MNPSVVRDLLSDALAKLMRVDGVLFERNVSERCICARVAFHLQNLVLAHDAEGNWSVDVEFNRDTHRNPKLLAELAGCANRFTADGRAYVTPDLILHRRGPAGPNIFVAEVKTAVNRESRDCDRRRIEAFCRHYHYTQGALIEFETRSDRSVACGLTWYTAGGWEACVVLSEVI